jgi:alkylation response protein AidB-like acyl-CoA dehydrogenase
MTPAPVVDYQRRYGLDDADEAWRAKAEVFARDVLAPIARTIDRDGKFPDGLVAQLGDAGLLGAPLPVAQGGGGASALATALISEEIGRVDGSVRGFLAVQSGLVAQTLCDFGTDEQKKRWLGPLCRGQAIGCFALTEPGAGSDVASLTTAVRVAGDHAVIDGRKHWITNATLAQVSLVFATADPAAGRDGLECWLVERGTRGMATHPMDGRELGHRGSDHARVEFNGARVPVGNRVGPARGGFRVAMKGLDHGRLGVAAGAVGIQAACLEACVAFARSRRQFGMRIGDFQQVGARLADMRVALETSRLLVHHAARCLDRGLPATAETSAAKLHATEAALRAATDAVRIHGARGYSDALPVERHYRDAIGLTIYEGTSEIQRVILARDLLGRDEPEAGATANS